MANTLSWHEKAACDGSYDDRFFDNHISIQRAVIDEYCKRCPVMDLYLLDALEQAASIGVWGGMTAAELHKVQRSPKYRLGMLSVNSARVF
jgi:hypothetical protein